jgi:hypothetical protein
MSFRKLVLLALAGSALAPASAAAAPTVTVTGDTGQPTPLNMTTPVGVRNMDVAVEITVPSGDPATYYTAQVFGPDGAAATPLSSCREKAVLPTARAFADYRGNGLYSVIVRYYPASDSNCDGTAPIRRFQYTINGGTAITPPPTKVLTRPAGSFSLNRFSFGVALNPGATTYEIRDARGGVTGPDGGITGASKETFVDTGQGLAPFTFEKPGTYTIVGRAKNGLFFTPWSAPVFVKAIAPFDLESVRFPDSRGPSYKLRAQVRERAARGRVRISIAKGRKGGKFRSLGRAKLNSKGRVTKRFRVRGFGKYRLRFTYRGSELVRAGRQTEQITITKRFFFR